MNTEQAGPDQEDGLLTSQQAADLITQAGINMPEGRLRQLRSAGRGPRYRKRDPANPRSDVRYLRVDVDNWIAQQHPANWPVAETTP